MCVCVCICVCVKPLHLRLFMFVPQRLQLLMCRLVLYKSGRVLLDEPVMPGEPVDSTGLCIRQTEISTTNHMKTIVPYHPRHESTPTTRNHTPTTRKLHMTQLLCRDIAAAHSQENRRRAYLPNHFRSEYVESVGMSTLCRVYVKPQP